MKFLRLLAVLLTSLIWRLMGIRPAGRALVRALGTDDEQVRAIAGMMLVKSGRKAEPLLQEALDRRENVSTVLTVLGSIGDPSIEPEIRRFADDKDPRVSKAARDALRVVHYKT
jgi:HEAT repeat protein